MSTNSFSDDEVEIILEAIKAKPHYLTAGEKDKLTIQVEIARKLTAKLEQQGQKGRRSALQVRYKLQQLHNGYLKIKGKISQHSYVSSQAVKYYYLLDEIFGHADKQKKKKTIKDIVTVVEPDELPTLHTYIIKEEECFDGKIDELATESRYGIQKSREGILSSSDENCKVRQVTEFADYRFKVPKTTGSISPVANESEQEAEDIPEEASNDDDENPVLRKVRQSFTSELMDSQRLLVATIKEQDKKYMRSFKDHCKNQAKILKRDRYEIKTILRKDREEMLKVLSTVVNAMGKTISYQVENNDDDKDDSDLTLSSGEADGATIEND